MQPYMKYLHNNHKHAFIILINAALDRRSMALIVAVERMIPVHTFLFNFEAYQTYAVSRKDQIRRQIIPRYLEGPSTIGMFYVLNFIIRAIVILSYIKLSKIFVNGFRSLSFSFRYYIYGGL